MSKEKNLKNWEDYEKLAEQLLKDIAFYFGLESVESNQRLKERKQIISLHSSAVEPQREALLLINGS